MKVLKVFLILLAAAFVAALVLLIDAVSVIDSAAAGLFVALELFLTIDLKGLIDGTRRKPEGGYDEMHLYRYITVLIIMALLGGLLIYMYKVHDLQAVLSMALFCSGVPVTVGLILGGLQENRNSQKVGPK